MKNVFCPSVYPSRGEMMSYDVLGLKKYLIVKLGKDLVEKREDRRDEGKIESLGVNVWIVKMVIGLSLKT